MNIKHMALAAFGIFAALLTGCDKDDEPQITADAVKVELSYKFGGNPSELLQGAVIVYQTPEGVKKDTVKCGGEWSKTLEFSTIPEKAGMQIHGILTYGVKAGETVSIDYSYRCGISLMEGGKAVKTETAEDSQKTTFVVAAGEAFHQMAAAVDKNLMFAVGTQEIRPFGECPWIDEPCLMEANTLYYAAPYEPTVEGHYMHNFFLSRFTDQKKWDGEALTKGDLIYLDWKEAKEMDPAPLQPYFFEGLLCIADGFEKGQDLIDFERKFGFDAMLGDPAPDEDISKWMVIYSKFINPSFDPTYKGRGETVRMESKDEEGNDCTDYMCWGTADWVANYIKEVHRGSGLIAADLLVGKWNYVKSYLHNGKYYEETAIDSPDEATKEYHADGTLTLWTVYGGEQSTGFLTWSLDRSQLHLTETIEGRSHTATLEFNGKDRFQVLYKKEYTDGSGQPQTGEFKDVYERIK